MTEKEAFFEKYAHCADNEALQKIWEAKKGKIKTLHLYGTKLKDLSPLLGLISLQKIYCFSTGINDIFPLSELINLQEIYTGSTGISDLSPLKNLIHLRRIGIESTKVNDLSPLSNLTNLESISCNETLINDLSPILHLLKKGLKVRWDMGGSYKTGIFIRDCPLTNPPIEIAIQGNEAILRYWEEQKRTGTKRVNEARLLVVGQGGAGKTTLKEKIRDTEAEMPKPDATTRGIEIYPFTFKTSEGEDFTLQIWDFGGQNIQHYAHQFFMSDSAVYALVSNEREQNPNFQYWLNIIEMLGKDSPVVIVRNEKDGHCEPLKNAAQIQERFGGIRSIEGVDLSKAFTDPRFEPLKKRLLAEAQLLPHVKKEYPTSFTNIRQKLQELAVKQQAISFPEFKKLCTEEGIEDLELMNDYARTFTVLGIALHFGDDVFLKKQVFLRPKWIIDALFQLLYHEKVEKQKGRFSESDAAAIWHQPEYEDFHGDLLRLMARFELCFAIEGTKQYIVPQRLPERIELFENQEATQVRYQYKFMPKGMLTRLTCRLHTRIDGEQVWSDAVQFTDRKDAKVFVREIYNEHTIEINAFGKDKEGLLNTVIDTLDDIHAVAQFANLRVEKLVPCPCRECVGQRTRGDSPHFFKYDFLLKKLARGGNHYVDCEKSTDEVRIGEILKHSGVRAFKIEEINAMLENDRIDDALNLLRGQYDETSDIVLQMSKLRSLENDHKVRGLLKFEDYQAEKAKIVFSVTEMLKRVG
jgi:internalin A